MYDASETQGSAKIRHPADQQTLSIGMLENSSDGRRPEDLDRRSKAQEGTIGQVARPEYDVYLRGRPLRNPSDVPFRSDTDAGASATN